MAKTLRKAFCSKLPAQQTDALQQLIQKHLEDPALLDFAAAADFTATSTERGLQQWEQAHLVAALDVINAYQRDRRARSAVQVGGVALTRAKRFKADPRTRMCEVLKRWLRVHAGRPSVSETDVRAVSGLCRDVLSHLRLFPSRNPRSFLQTMAEVHDHLQLQLRDTLERDRSCADAAQRVLTLGRNLVSDAVGVLLLGVTELRHFDALPSLEVVALWQALPDAGHPLPGRVDRSLQRATRDAWATRCGALLASVLCAPSCVRLFRAGAAEPDAGAAGAEGGGAGAPSVAESLEAAAAQFAQGDFKTSGLAGAFRDPQDPDAARTRESFLSAVRATADLTYLLSEVLVQFHRVGDGLGDYGMIRMAPWLHPFLDSCAEKAQRLRADLESLSAAADSAYVLARARTGRVVRPAPSDRMSARAHACAQRALTGSGCHVAALLQAFDELKALSAPERLPLVGRGLGRAAQALEGVLGSGQFRACVGDAFPALPLLTEPRKGGSAPPLGELLPASDGEGGAESPGSQRSTRAPSEGSRRPAEEVTAEVRFVSGPHAARPRERGSLVLRGDLLLICSAAGRVAAVVDPEVDLEACRVQPGGLLVLTRRRAREGQAVEIGGDTCEDLAFEFDSEGHAMAFHASLTALA